MARSISPRRYDATERRRLAEQQRRDSRRRVVAAATQCFLQAGYSATAIADVARAAGVAVQTVYSSVGGKADLLIAVVNQAVAGDDRDVMFLEREWMNALRAEPDPHRQVRIFTDTMTAIGARVVPLYVVMRAAAAGDPDVDGLPGLALRSVGSVRARQGALVSAVILNIVIGLVTSVLSGSSVWFWQRVDKTRMSRRKAAFFGLHPGGTCLIVMNHRWNDPRSQCHLP